MRSCVCHYIVLYGSSSTRKRSTARGLLQEFVRVRAEREKERPALLAALCKRTCKQGVIIFFRSKKLAHQMRVVFGLLDMKAEELHGDLTQEQVRMILPLDLELVS